MARSSNERASNAIGALNKGRRKRGRYQRLRVHGNMPACFHRTTSDPSMPVAASPRAPETELCDLLASVAAGDKIAFRRLYDKAVPKLFPICVRLMRDRDAAQDVLQEAMLRIWQKAHLFDASKGKALPWMAVLTRNCALSRLAVAAPPTSSIDEEHVLATVESRLAFDPMEGGAVRECLKMLSEKYRRCVTLVYLYGLSYQELADQLSVPIGTVKTWVHRSVKELAACVEREI